MKHKLISGTGTCKPLRSVSNSQSSSTNSAAAPDSSRACYRCGIAILFMCFETQLTLMSTATRAGLLSRQVGKIKNLIDRDLFVDLLRLAGVLDGVRHELGVDATVGGFDELVLVVDFA